MNKPRPTKVHKAESATHQDETVDAAHPSDDQFAMFVAGRLDSSESQAVQTHLAGCNLCVIQVEELYGSISDCVAEVKQNSAHPSTTTSTQSADRDPNATVDHASATAQQISANDQSESGTFGDYELLNEIARGAMGVVYRARQKSLNRIIALKMIKSGEFANQEQVDRFYKEAEAAAHLDHPGIVQVFEVGEVDGQHYFTMAFVEGESLADRLRNGPLAPKEAAQYARSIAEAVAFAHSKGVIHRDLKPGNVLITKEDTLRITDFGLAKRIEEDSELTSTGQVLGTPSYMPPEQAEGKLREIGPAADVYAIGATLYSMLIGRPPFQAENLIETLNEVLNSDPVPVKSLNSTIPLDLDTLCLKCLEKKPSNRYESADELVIELSRFLDDEPITARPIGRLERATRWCKRKPIHATALIAIALIPVISTSLLIRLSLVVREAAIARVETLLNASPATIPLILEELDRDATVVNSRLHQLKSDDLTPEERLRLCLALLPTDATQLQYLNDRVEDCSYEELEVLLDRVRDHDGRSLVPELWTTFRDNRLTEEQRFRTGIALAALDPDSENWEEGDYDFLVNSMLAVNTVYQPAVRRSLAPMASKLVRAVKSAYDSSEPGTLADESSANAAVDFAGNDSELLTDLSLLSTPKQHSIVFPVLESLAASDETVVDKFVAITKMQPESEDDEATRIKLGKRRAGAAINLVRLNRLDAALEVLRVKEDPESLTQFVHGCEPRGITVEQLLDLLNRAISVSERYGILLALGEFTVTEIPEDIRSAWADHVKDLYANDPSSGIHGASGWLLRRWGLIAEAKAIDERAVPYSEDREWFTLKINVAGALEFEEYSYLTFIVFPGGEYEIGSPDYEQDRDPYDEQRRMVKITRPFAVLNREVTRGEVAAVTGFGGYTNDKAWQKDPLSASAAMNWYLAVKFCRGLTNRRGFSERDQVYADPSRLDRDEYPVDPSARFAFDRGVPLNWPVDFSNSGFRLPTSTESEIACRSRIVTTFGFGSDRGVLDQYGWYHQGSSGNHGHRPRKLRPNLRGLFDMHGNLNEWCHDWHGGNVVEDTVDPMGPPEGSLRVLRGGGWNGGATYCRSANRINHEPADASFSGGFRVVLTIGVSSSHPQ